MAVIYNPDPNAKWTIKKFQITVIKSNTLENVDYIQLEKFLEEKKWREADRETNNLILKAANRKEQGHLDANSITQLSCEYLQIIDRLWIKFSHNRFGFSVQNQIYRKVGGTENFEQITWAKFADLVGWTRSGKWLDQVYSLDAPLGHLPFLQSRQNPKDDVIFFSRIAACNLDNNILKTSTFRLTKKLFFARKSENFSALQVIENFIIAHGWIEITNERADADYIVTINENQEYIICDRTETPYPNLTPPLSVNGTDSPKRLVKRLVHLAKYHLILELENTESELNNAIEYELLDAKQQPFPDPSNIRLKSGDHVDIRLKNVSSQPLNVAVLDFEATWEISQIPIQGDREAFFPLKSGQETLTRLRFQVPDEEDYQQSEETLKLFVTRGIVNFQCLILPPLDSESQSRANLDEELRDVLAEYFDKDKDWSSKSINLTTIQPEPPLKQQPQQEDKPTKLKKILLLACNPQASSVLNLEREIRDIREGLRRSQNRDQFVIETRGAVRPEDLRRAMLEVKPQIVHFCGHGTGSQGLVLEDDDGNEHLASKEALSDLFRIFSNRVECVLLNACYSEVQAQGIIEHINYVIGMNREVPDDATIAFTVGFYDALGAGESIEHAFEIGINAVLLEVSGHESQSRKLSPVNDIDVSINEPKNQDYLLPVLMKKV